MFSAASKTGSQPAAAFNYVEDVFSTYLYNGTGATQTITNNIDLSGKGGLTWIKTRSGTTGHRFTDTVRGATKSIASNSAAAQATESTGLTAFSSTGFTIGADADYNTNAATYCSWTFREQPKFFDIVTYTGNSAIRNISHNLGSVPGMIIIKCFTMPPAVGSTDWIVYHRSLANTEYLTLNSTNAKATSTTYFDSTTPTSTEFTLGSDQDTNQTDGVYVAYLFAHDAGGFGTSGTDNVISCGSYTGTGSAGNTVNLGYEPQYLMVKPASRTGAWIIVDNMRAFSETSNLQLFANSTAVEDTPLFFTPTATGFKLPTTSAFANGSGETYIYMAIRRPMKVPTDAIKVFSPIASTASTGTKLTTGFPVDLQIWNYRGSASLNSNANDRLREVSTLPTIESGQDLITSTTDAEAASIYTRGWDNVGFEVPSGLDGLSMIYYNFSRRPGFFDEVCYTGTGSSATFNHNLGVVPELIITKGRGYGGPNWNVYASPLGNTKVMYLNTTNTPFTYSDVWDNTSPTSTVFTLGSAFEVNRSARTYVAYLFATCPGVSKVGSYTGNGGTQAIACGFTGGARFVLIKRTDVTGGWYVYDTARGMTTLTNPYLFFNTIAAESATLGSVTTTTGGFTVDATILAAINTNAASYIFLAIA